MSIHFSLASPPPRLAKVAGTHLISVCFSLAEHGISREAYSFKKIRTSDLNSPLRLSGTRPFPPPGGSFLANQEFDYMETSEYGFSAFHRTRKASALLSSLRGDSSSSRFSIFLSHNVFLRDRLPPNCGGCDLRGSMFFLFLLPVILDHTQTFQRRSKEHWLCYTTQNYANI